MNAQIKTDPRWKEFADATAQVLYRKNVDELPENLQADVWRTVYYHYQQQNPQPGHCHQCGAKVKENAYECRPCHEGEGFPKIRRVF